MSDIIKALKENEKPFGLMSKEMQDKANKIGPQEFQYWANRKWAGPNSYFGPENIAYRLRSNYVEEPKIVKCEIKPRDYYLRFKYNKIEHNLYHASYIPDFIGFLYESGQVEFLPRVFKGSTSTKSICQFRDLSDIEVLTPTHVLFRSKP